MGNSSRCVVREQQETLLFITFGSEWVSYYVRVPYLESVNNKINEYTTLFTVVSSEIWSEEINNLILIMIQLTVPVTLPVTLPGWSRKSGECTSMVLFPTQPSPSSLKLILDDSIQNWCH